jgi:xylitol oxidase
VGEANWAGNYRYRAGRLHWGKLFLADAAAIASLYERLPDCTLLAGRLDSRGAFRTTWLRSHVLGPE